MMLAEELNRDVLSCVLSALLRLQTVCLQGLQETLGTREQ